MAQSKNLPATPSWFRLPEYVKDLLERVGILESQEVVGATGVFTNTDGDTLTIVNGIVTDIDTPA